jgi:F-type H+-transporting ATPase subunit epsilon
MATMEVFVVTPDRELWSGEATLVVARGSEGDVGIQVGHAPMLIQLGIGPLFVQTSSERVAVAVDGGFLHVVSQGGDSRVDVLAEHADLAAELDAGRVQQMRTDAEELARTDNPEAAVAMAKATVRQNLLH